MKSETDSARVGLYRLVRRFWHRRWADYHYAEMSRGRSPVWNCLQMVRHMQEEDSLKPNTPVIHAEKQP